MKEIELKFQVPPAAAAAVEAQLQTAGATTIRLAARYYDTADRRLAQAGFALRLRLEGTQWVQTLKGRAAGAAGLIERLEHNAALPGVAALALPELDLQRHAGTPAGMALQALLDAAGVGVDALQIQYDTDISRLQHTIRHGAAGIELAFDRGLIRSGPRTLAVCELEFELLDGPRAELIAASRAWVQQLGLWLDVRSKAERGDRLARQLISGPVHQLPAVLADAWPALLNQALAALLPNLADLAGETATPEHAVALQQGAARFLQQLSTIDGVPAGLHAAAQTLAHAASGADVAAALRAVPLQLAVLDLLGWGMG
jgi:inorganic triphosphatase YgiF